MSHSVHPGLGVKTALPGQHFWLPVDPREGACPVIALLTGWRLKTGAFAS